MPEIFKQRIPVILASGSPRRKELLLQLGVSLEIIVPRVAEKTSSTEPAQIVCSLAQRKARAVAERLTRNNNLPVRSRCLIIAADTIVVLDNKILGKPINKKDAERMLLSLRGTVHYVYSGLAIISYPEKKIFTTYSRTKVKIRAQLSPRMISRLARKHLDKAGAYAVQEHQYRLVEKIWGDYYTVVGLPVPKLRQYFRKINFFSPAASVLS